jgi:plasmid stability protein
MSSITIRNLDPAIKERLRIHAAEHGHSMEAEGRRILETALTWVARPQGRNLYERVRARFAPLGGVILSCRKCEKRRSKDGCKASARNPSLPVDAIMQRLAQCNLNPKRFV